MAFFTRINYILIFLGASCLRISSADPTEPKDQPEIFVSRFHNVTSRQFTWNSVFQPEPDMWYYLISLMNRGAWWVEGKNDTYFEQLKLHYLSISKDHLFRFERVWERESFYTIESKGYPETFLEVKDVARNDPAPIIQAKLKSESKQHWMLEVTYKNIIRLRPRSSLERCVGVKFGSQDHNEVVTVYECSSGTEEPLFYDYWEIIPAIRKDLQ